MRKTINVDVDVDVDLEDFEDEELAQELKERDRGDLLSRDDGADVLLRHGIEDRDWSKIEEAARLMGVQWFRLTDLRCVAKAA